jgi:hypothetical protein
VSPRSENNAYLLASFRGVEEKGISPKWNIKIYKESPKKRGHSVVCVDDLILRKLLEADYAAFVPPDRTVLSIDDAGWGFPLCGVMVGVSDERIVRTAVVPVEYFRHDTRDHFGTGRYRERYAELAIGILAQFGATTGTHRIEICTGYINQRLRRKLRGRGYDVRVVEIQGLLQRELEERFRQYVTEDIGSDLYYDPKELGKREIPRRYYQSLEFGMRHCPHKLKTGWESIQGTRVPTRRDIDPPLDAHQQND